MSRKPDSSSGSCWNVSRCSQTLVTPQGPRGSYFWDVLWGCVASVSQLSHQPLASTAFVVLPLLWLWAGCNWSQCPVIAEAGSSSFWKWLVAQQPTSWLVNRDHGCVTGWNILHSHSYIDGQHFKYTGAQSIDAYQTWHVDFIQIHYQP